MDEECKAVSSAEEKCGVILRFQPHRAASTPYATQPFLLREV
jgi:hypothetical protein